MPTLSSPVAQGVVVMTTYGVTGDEKWHTITRTIFSWPNPEQWLMIHTSDLLMIIRETTHILTIITREVGKLTHTHSYIVFGGLISKQGHLVIHLSIIFCGSIFQCDVLFVKPTRLPSYFNPIGIDLVLAQRGIFPFICLFCSHGKRGRKSEGHTATLVRFGFIRGCPCVPVWWRPLFTTGPYPDGRGAVWGWINCPASMCPPRGRGEVRSSTLSLPLWVWRTLQPAASRVSVLVSAWHQQHWLGLLWCGDL